MIVTLCPSCGRPTPARLATPDVLRCAACGYDGAPPEKDREHLRAAHEQLFAADAGARQLSVARASALARNESRRFAIVFVLSSLPTTLVFASAIRGIRRWNSGSDDTTWLALTTAIFVAMWALGVASHLTIARRQARVRAACAATPPLRAGDPSTCRVCGADLPPGASVVRCRHCATDNFAAPGVAKRIQTQESFDVARFREAIADAARRTREAGTNASALVLALALGLPIGAAIFLSALEPLLMRIERPVDEHVLYASAIAREGECFGRLREGGPLDFGRQALFDFPQPTGAKTSARVLEGRAVASDEVSGTVERVYGSPMGNLALVRTDRGTTRVDVRGLCLPKPAPTKPLATGGTFAADRAAIFETDGSRVLTARPDGDDGHALADIRGLYATALALDGDTVFVGDGVNHALYAVARGSGAVKKLGAAPQGQHVLALAASPGPGGLFVATKPNGGLLVMRKDGSDPHGAATPFDLLSAVAAYGDDVFASGHTKTGTSSLVVVRGASASTFELLHAGCTAFAVDATTVYCGYEASIVVVDRTTRAERTLWKLPEPFMPPGGYVEEINAVAVDDSDVWFVWSDSHTRDRAGLLLHVPKRGGDPVLVASDLARPSALFLGADAAYVVVNPTNQFDKDLLLRIPKRP